jgi:transcriptional regulator with XRE-family HTH domain
MTTARRYCRRGTSLARDNTGLLCAVCQQKPRRDRAPEVPPDFWYTDAMVDALASGDLGRVIRAYRLHPWHGHKALSQTVVAGWLHVSQTSLSRIEQGKCRLTVDDINWFAGALGLNVALRWAPEHQAGEDVDPFSRRSLLSAGVGAALGLGAIPAPTTASEVDPALVSHWLRLLDALGQYDRVVGPRAVLNIARSESALIEQYRRAARGAVRTDLEKVEARWADYASWLCDDTGDSEGADYWLDRAAALAEDAGERPMVSFVLAHQSRLACDRRDTRRAITLAESAQQMRGITRPVRALAALREARARAQAGDVRGCQLSLRDAYELVEGAQPPGSDVFENLAFTSTTHAYVHLYEADCWLRLQQPDRAVALFEQTLKQLPDTRRRDRGLHGARLAVACAAAGAHDRAAAEGSRAVEIAKTTRSERTLRELRRLDRELAGSSPAAADFREAFATL